MGSYQSPREPPPRDRWSGLQRVLVILIVVCLVVVTVLSYMLVRMAYNPTGSGQQPAPPVVIVSPTPALSPTATTVPSPTPSPTPPPPPSPTPTTPPWPTPSPAPGVLPYPLYSGNSRLPEIALTFDDGPNPPYTSQVLAILQQYHVPATFFLIGSEAASYPALVSQEAQQGFVVGDHTWTHPDLTKLPPDQVRSELQRTAQEIRSITGVAPIVFRPPGGNFNSQVQAIAASLGLSTILWNVDPKDWSRPGTSVIIQRVLDATHNGSIILMHDGGGDRSQTVAALPTIITTLEQRGYQFVTIPQMIQKLPPEGTVPANISPDQFSPEQAFVPGQSFHGDVLTRWSLFN
jgi:peptidoglycan/xylan/chitin deacetylase (PgdA/CDA1 family)